jgi:predicted DNA-binding mobile mystery protein A
MSYDSLVIRQLDKLLSNTKQAILLNPIPMKGWIHTLRNALGMSARQLGSRLGISQQSITKLEQSEREESISLKSLKATAEALDCNLYYVLIPKNSLEEIIDTYALKKAQAIYSSTTHSMLLEEQGVSHEETQIQINELAKQIKENSIKTIWD